MVLHYFRYIWSWRYNNVSMLMRIGIYAFSPSRNWKVFVHQSTSALGCLELLSKFKFTWGGWKLEGVHLDFNSINLASENEKTLGITDLVEKIHNLFHPGFYIERPRQINFFLIQLTFYYPKPTKILWFCHVENRENTNDNSEEAVIRLYYVKKVFLKVSQNSKKNSCAKVSFLIKLQAEASNFIKKETLAQVFSC